MGVSANGCHTNISLWKGDENVFLPEGDDMHMPSRLGLNAVPVVDATSPIVIVTIALRMDAHQPTALVVDDDASLRLLCRVNLELEGFSVREAGTLQDAEAAVDAERPDVVLLDVHLGGDESTSLLEWLRAAGIPGAGDRQRRPARPGCGRRGARKAVRAA
jgi:hypothetical protein